MEPQLPKPQFSPEASAPSRTTPQGGEAFTVPRAPETTAPIEQGRETHEQAYDGPQGDPAAQPAFTPPPMPTIDPVQVNPTTSVSDNNDDSNPVSASDEDLIEKEWVEKAKKVISETRDDPHAQDLAVGKLQADYLKKRYGKTVALPEKD